MIYVNIIIAILLAGFLIASQKAGVLYNALFLFLAVSVLTHLGLLIYQLMKGQFGIDYWQQNLIQLGHSYWIKLLIIGAFYAFIAFYNTSRLPEFQMGEGLYNGFKYFVIASCIFSIAYAILPSKQVNWPVLAVMGCFCLFMGKEFIQYQKTTFDNAITLNNPFKSLAVVGQGGNSVLYNHHYPAISQRYAVDFILPNSTLDADGMPSQKLTDYTCFGAPLYSPIDGEVVSVESGLPDVAIGDSDSANPVGNFVTIKYSNDVYVLLAHMKQNSITVKMGDKVRQGEPVLGECGNSGNTSEPHLHIQAQDHADFRKVTQTYPLYFEQHGKTKFVRANDVID